MTGPEHYREAERLLAVADVYDEDGAWATAKARRAEAQVHATLALAAATALIAPQGAGRSIDVQQWINAAGGGAR